MLLFSSMIFVVIRLRYIQQLTLLQQETIVFTSVVCQKPETEAISHFCLKIRKPFRNPLKPFQKSSQDLESMSVGLGIDFNLFDYVFTILGENRKKIIKNYRAAFEVYSVKSIFLSEKKEFLKKLFIDLKLRI